MIKVSGVLWIKEGGIPVEAVPPGMGRRIRVGDREVALFHLESGDWVALDPACPHEGGPLAHGILSGECVICPLHGWRIHLPTGEALDGPGRVRVWPVRVEKGRVHILLE